MHFGFLQLFKQIFYCLKKNWFWLLANCNALIFDIIFIIAIFFLLWLWLLFVVCFEHLFLKCLKQFSFCFILILFLFLLKNIRRKTPNRLKNKHLFGTISNAIILVHTCIDVCMLFFSLNSNAFKMLMQFYWASENCIFKYSINDCRLVGFSFIFAFI